MEDNEQKRRNMELIDGLILVTFGFIIENLPPLIEFVIKILQ